MHVYICNYTLGTTGLQKKMRNENITMKNSVSCEGNKQRVQDSERLEAKSFAGIFRKGKFVLT